MKRRRLLRNGVVAVTLTLAGCRGDGETPASAPTSTPTSPSTPTATPTPTATSTGSNTPTEQPTGTETEEGTWTRTTTDEGTPTDTRTATETPTRTASETPTRSATETPAESPTPTATPEADQTVVVGPNDTFTFDPSSFTVQAGDTVLWTWDSSGHNVRPSNTPDGSNWTGTPGGDGTTYNEGYTYRYTFDATGSYEYYCAPHRQFGMTGSFQVE